MSAVEAEQGVKWWPLAVGAVVYVAGFFTPWTVIISVALLAASVFGLTRRPSTVERRILIAGVIVLALTIVAFVALWIMAMTLSSTHSGTSNPL